MEDPASMGQEEDHAEGRLHEMRAVVCRSSSCVATAMVLNVRHDLAWFSHLQPPIASG